MKKLLTRSQSSYCHVLSQNAFIVLPEAKQAAISKFKTKKKKKSRMKSVVPLKPTSRGLSSLLKTFPLPSLHTHSNGARFYPSHAFIVYLPRNKSSMKSEVSSASFTTLRPCLTHCGPAIPVEGMHPGALGTSGSKSMNKDDSLLLHSQVPSALERC